MKPNLDQFGKTVAASRLLSGDELKTFWQAIPQADRPKDAEALARRLVEAGKLNEFQVAELLAGRDTPLVLGDYVLLAKIGAGGMGQVFLAEHRVMKRRVAIKLLPPSLTQDDAAIKRFQREVQAAARLSHPNIVAAFDASSQRGVWYLVMEYVEGRDLSALVKERGPLPIEQAVGFVVQAARGLAFAHAEHVIHRDIKPANLLVDNKGTVKILDMGLARFDGGDDGLTGTEQVMGTVDYMSPEQSTNTKGVDSRADIYSLGCTLWFLLTGKKAYDADTMVARLMAHRDGPLPSLVKTRDDAPWALEQVFHKMIAKRPADRYQTMDDVVAALEPFATSAHQGPGSSIGMGGKANSELAAFLQTVQPQPAGKAAKSATSTNLAPTNTVAAVEATAAFRASEANTDPKSEILGQAPTAPKGPPPKSARPRKRPVGLMAGAAVGVVAVVAAGIFFAMRNGVPEPNATVPAIGRPAASATATDSPFSTPAELPGARDRAAALQAFVNDASQLGIVGTEAFYASRRDISRAEDLPAEPFFLTSVGFRPGEAHPLADLSGLTKLSFINISDSGTSDAEFRQLRDVPALESVKASGTRIGDASLQWAADHFPALTTLDLRSAFAVTDAGLKHLERLANLTELRLQGNGVTPEGVASFQRAKPNCRVEWDQPSILSPPPSPPPGSVPVANPFALAFSGVSSTTIDPLEVDFSKPLTIEGYFRPTALSDPRLEDKLIGVNRVFLLNFRNGTLIPELSVGHHQRTDFPLFTLSPAHAQWLPTGRDTHLAAEWDPPHVRFFINGKLAAARDDLPLDVKLKANGIVVADHFIGHLDEVRVSRVARYKTEFTPAPRFEPDADTLCLYHCDDGTGNVLKDAGPKKLNIPMNDLRWVPGEPRYARPSTPSSPTTLPDVPAQAVSG